MGIDDGTFDRHAAGEDPVDDPAWGGVAAFLDELRSAYPPGPTAAVEAEHLAAMARESRIMAAGRAASGASVLSLRRTRFRRALVSTVAGATVLLTAGVGAAAAMGINPIAQLVAPRIDQPVTITPAPAPTSGGNPSAPDGGRPTNHTPTTPPSPTHTPTDGGSVVPTTGESAKPTKVEKTKKPKKEKKAKKVPSDKDASGEKKTTSP